MKRILKIITVVLLLLLVSGILYVNYSVPKLPEGSDAIIEQVLTSELPPLKGKQGYALNGKTKIWYEATPPTDSLKGNVVLIMGIANDALAWPDYFIEPFTKNGYQVIRFDNRGTGMTDWFDDWDKNDPLIDFEHGKKCAALIPNADTLWVRGMGHDIPEVFTPPITTKILHHMHKTIAQTTSD